MWPKKKRQPMMPAQAKTLPGREKRAYTIASFNLVTGNSMEGPYPEGFGKAMFGLGCFWGAERIFWSQDGVWTTAVGYAGGSTPHPTYEEVCTGRTGHNEVVFLAFDPSKVTYADLLRLFFASHDPTQGMRQGNDIGTQYRSGIYTFGDEQAAEAHAAIAAYQAALERADFGRITTEVIEAPKLYFAEDYHQQYLAKNPLGYCGLGGTGVTFPKGVSAS